MSNTSLHALILLFLFSISSTFPVSEKHHHVPRLQKSSTPPSNPSFILTALRNSLARIFPFHQTASSEPAIRHIGTEQPADQKWQPHPLPVEEEHSHQSSNLPSPQQNHLDTSSEQQLSKDDLLHMVTMGKKMFQAIEAALTNSTKTLSQSPHEPLHEQNQHHENFASALSHAPIEQRNELSRAALPDVRLALAQAEQLNKRREMERQAKLAQWEQEQANPQLEHIEGLPRSAPSYPTRVRLQTAMRKHGWATSK